MVPRFWGEVVVGHADAVVLDGEGAGGLVGGDADGGGVGWGEGGVGEGEEAAAVGGVGGVGDELAEEDLAFGVEGVDDEVEQAADFGVEGVAFGGFAHGVGGSFEREVGGAGAGRKAFFFEKKKQKSFWCGCRGFCPAGARQGSQTFFGSFFQKRTACFCVDERMDDLLTDLAGLTDAFAARAGALDAAGAFPEENVADLRRVGALVAALPRALGGRGFGTEAAGAAGAAEMLRLVGRGHLATGRLFEGHVNAVKLVVRYGGPAVVARVAEVARAGGLVGLWVTDGGEALRVCGGVLEGGKVFCSGAGHVGHALVTAEGEDGTVMALVEVAEGRAQAGAMRLSGMRAAVTGRVELSGVVAEVVGGVGGLSATAGVLGGGVADECGDAGGGGSAGGGGGG